MPVASVQILPIRPPRPRARRPSWVIVPLRLARVSAFPPTAPPSSHTVRAVRAVSAFVGLGASVRSSLPGSVCIQHAVVRCVCIPSRDVCIQHVHPIHLLALLTGVTRAHVTRLSKPPRELRRGGVRVCGRRAHSVRCRRGRRAAWLRSYARCASSSYSTLCEAGPAHSNLARALLVHVSSAQAALRRPAAPSPSNPRVLPSESYRLPRRTLPLLLRCFAGLPPLLVVSGVSASLLYIPATPTRVYISYISYSLRLSWSIAYFDFHDFSPAL
ncbi:hypothetical protein C8R44DRAFT_983042 [Mycena epipterygia]|nr:hypothetical protein C8R44DRAFT_983042 [Mycena epipterygia]